MLTEVYKRAFTQKLGSNCCSFIVMFASLSSATLKCERVLMFLT